MSDIQSRQIMEELMLRQLGAHVLSRHGINTFAKFEINGQKISYLFNINQNNLYYLQRISPYQMPLGKFKLSTDVVEAISNDFQLMQNATGSGNYEVLSSINSSFLEARVMLEKQFMDYNIDKHKLDELCKKIDDLKQYISSLSDDASTIDL